MKKNVITLLLAVVMTLGNVGNVPALAAEATTQEVVAAEEETVEDAEEESAETKDTGTGEVSEDTTETESVDETEEVPEQELAEESDTTEESDKTEVEELKKEQTASSEAGGNASEESEQDVVNEDKTENMSVDVSDGDSEEYVDEEIETEVAQEAAMVGDNGEEDYVAQAIWTEGNTTLTFYYGPLYDIGDTFDGQSITNIWNGTDVTNSGNTQPKWIKTVRESVTNIIVDSTFSAVRPNSTAFWFYRCESLIDINLRGLDTSNVTNMSYMFYNCISLENIDVSGFNTSNVTNMSALFCFCQSLTSLDVSNFDTSGVEYMTGMFCGCNTVKHLDVSGFDTSNVRRMDNMFLHCDSLISLDVSHFDTSGVDDIAAMFAKCTTLKSLDLSGFNVEKVTHTMQMFEDCNNLEVIYCKDRSTDWSYIEDSARMFLGCTALIGKDSQFEISFNSSNTDSAMAKSASLGGYFTPKSQAPATGAEGQCGDSVSWAFDPDGTLEIRGTGPMYDYAADGNDQPWASFREYITDILIGDGVTTIGRAAFMNCTSLESVSIAETVTSIGDNAFYGCSGLKRVGYGGSSEKWKKISIGSGNEALDGKNYIYVDPGVEYPDDPTSKCGLNLRWTIDDAGTLTVRGTGDMYDYDSDNNLRPWGDKYLDIKEVVIETGVTSIGDNAFSNCPFLKNVHLSDSVTVIGEGAFSGCKTLDEINLTNGIVELKELAFAYTGFQSISIPSSLTRVGSNAFLNDALMYACYEGNKDEWLRIDIDKSGNEAIDYLKTKIYFNSSDIPSYAYKDWWGFDNDEVTKNHHIDESIWRSVLGVNILSKFSGTRFGDKDTKDGLCSGMVETAMLFDNGFIKHSDFEQNPIPARVYDLNKSAYNSNVDLTAEDMIKLTFILQYIPDFYEEISVNNINNYDGLCDAVSSYMQSGEDPVYVSLMINEMKRHALWAYYMEEEDEYCDIYLYDCNYPELPQILRFYGHRHSFTGFQYLNPKNTYDFKIVSFASHIDDVILAVATHKQLSPKEPLVSIRKRGYMIVNMPSGITYLKDSYNRLLPIRTTNQSDSNNDNTELYYIKAEDTISVFNEEEECKVISFTDDVSDLEIELPKNGSAELQDYCLDTHYSDGDVLSGTYTTTAGEDSVSISFTGAAAKDIQLDFSGDELIVSGQSDMTIAVEYLDNVISSDVSVDEGGDIHIKTDEKDDGNAQIIISVDGDGDGISEKDDVIDLVENQSIEFNERVTAVFDPKNIINGDAYAPQYLYTGSPIEPAMTLSLGDKILTKDSDYSLNYDNNINAGTAKVTITGMGKYTGTIEKTFEITPKAITPTITLSKTPFIYNGKAQKPGVTVNDEDVTLVNGTDYTATYRNNTNAGTASVVIKCKGNYTGTATKNFSIAKKTVSALKISGITNKTYNKKAQTQAVVVKNGTVTLKNGTDYSLSYKNNTNAGTASVIITGKGNYKGSVTKNFTIKKAVNKITAKNFTKVYSTSTQSFALGVKIANGTPKYASNTKSVTVSAKGVVTIKPKFIGKAVITITAPAYKNYNKATKKITVTVNPTKTGITSVTSPAAGQMLVKWKKNAVGTGYQIQYSTSSKFTGVKNAWITKNTVTSKKITGLTKGKKYYVRMRTYKTVGGVKYYSGWCTVKAVTIKK